MDTLQPPGWPRPSGYANGVAASGKVVALAGQIGWNPRTGKFEADDFVGQVKQALANIVAIMREAGAEPGHVVRLTWYITDKAAYVKDSKAIGDAYREAFGRHYPAMSVVVVAGLLEPKAKVEIEATAVVPA